MISRQLFFSALALFLLYSWDAGCKKNDATVQTRDANRTAVTALGRVTPGRAAISIAAQTGSRILKLEVSDGTRVKAGDVLAYLETYPLRLAERDQAQVALAEAREHLEAETRYDQAVIEQSEQSVRVMEITLEREKNELTRAKSMKTAVEAKLLDDQKGAVDKAEGELSKARAELRASQAALARAPSTI